MSIADILRAAGRKVVEIDSTKDAAMVADEVLRVTQTQEQPAKATKPIADVDCEHGSRWIWSPSLNRWFNVVLSSECDCDDPPADWPESDPEARAALRAAGRLPEEKSK